jgi:hypothetical protein
MRGWVVKYKSGDVIPEWEFGQGFSRLPEQNNIEAVAIVHRDTNRSWVISGKKHYFAQKQESLLCGAGGFFGRQIESRTIGYWEDGKKVLFTVNEATGVPDGPRLA